MTSFTDGLRAARAELARHPLSHDELLLSLGLFHIDPPDSPFQRGYMRVINRLCRASAELREQRTVK
jgi:hypothetical protein